MPVFSEEQGIRIYSADTIKKICLDAGADDVGLVDLDRRSVQKEKEIPLMVSSMNSLPKQTIYRR